MRQLITCLTAAAAVVTFGTATAQPAKLRASAGHKRHFVAPIQSKWQSVGSGAAAKTTAIDVRMIGLAELEYDGTAYVPVDSSEMSYIGMHGGTFNELSLSWDWNFDTAYTRQWTGSTYGARDYRSWQHFNTADLSDTSTYDEWAGTAWQAGHRSIYTYDAANNVLSVTGEDWDVTSSSWQSAGRQLYTYTLANKLESETYESWSGTSWVPGYRAFHTWSVGGLLMEDSTQYYDGMLPGWVSLQKLLYTYDGSNNRIKTTSCYWVDTTWDTVFMIYASGFVGNHQPQTIVYTEQSLTPGVYDSSHRQHYTYNSYSKPTHYYDEEWDAATNAWVKTTSNTATRMYYEEYGAGVGVGKDLTKSIDVTVYPVPASDNITISAKWGTPQAFSASITDMAGRTYTSWSGKTAGQYHEKVPVTNLPAGNYMLTVHTKEGSVTKQFSVVR